MPAQDALMARTLTPASLAWMAKSMAAMAPLVVPVPLLSKNFSPMIWVVQLMPTTPAPSGAAPMVPAMWVPWL